MDADLREAQRSAAQGDPEAEARHLRARVRAGTLSQDMLELAAYCGHEAARVVLGWEAGGNGRVYVRNPGGCATGFPDANLLPNSVAFRNWLNGLKRWKRGVETECPTCPLRGKVRPPLKRWATCRKCKGTGKVPREIPEALLRAAVACARACLEKRRKDPRNVIHRSICPWDSYGLWPGINERACICPKPLPFYMRDDIAAEGAVEAAERHVENPTEENRKACEAALVTGLPYWCYGVLLAISYESHRWNIPALPQHLPGVVQAAAEILTEKTARTVIQAALIEWALTERPQ